MLALLLIFVCWGLIIYSGLSDPCSIGFITFMCLFTVFIVLCLCFITVQFFTTVDEHEIQYDSYSIESNKFFSSTGILYFYKDGQLTKLSYNSIDVFVGDINGKIVIQETRFNSPDWFWLVAFIPDDMLLRTDVLIV